VRLLAGKLAVYDAAIAATDRAIGELWLRLGARGLHANTLLSVFSDHGEEFLDHLTAAHRWDHDPRPYRGIGHGHTLFQELLHVPWLAVGPGVPVARRWREPVSLCDLAPTLAEWLDVPPFPLPKGGVAGQVGRSLAAEVAREEVAVAAEAARSRPLLAESLAFGPDLVAVRRGRWKLIATRIGEPLALYDLENDPRERHDRAAVEPDVLGELRDQLAAWRETAAGSDEEPPTATWSELSDEVRRRLQDLGYAE
jgi:arylsulfatase A-like enzyme